MKLDMNNTDKLLALYQSGKGLLNFVNERLPFVRDPESRHTQSQIDKHEDGFYFDNACQSMNIRELCYKSFTGSYGSSSTYSDIAGMDSDLMKKYFLKYLNLHKDEILREMGEMMIEDAKITKSNALSEIESVRKKIEKMFPESSNEKDNVQ